jgi:cytoskeletal protein RodZ
MADAPGRILKHEREMRNISIEAICSFTKIKEHHLKAIEEDRFELLPHPLYVKGYLKSYARYLTLDEKNILGLYEDYLKSLLPPEPPVLPPKTLPQKKNIRSWFSSSLLIAIILFTTLFTAYILNNPTDDKPLTSPLFTVSPASAIQREEEKQAMDVARPTEMIELENKKADPQPTSVIEVLEAGMGTNVEKENDRQFLTGNALDFNSNNQRGYFFTRIKTPRPGKIAHVWLREGKEFHRIEMEVKPPAWSVYSYLTFQSQHVGNWKTEAREGDQVLTSLNFKVLQ